MQNVKIPVSVGELFDKFTILQNKKERIKDLKKLKYIDKEIHYLKSIKDSLFVPHQIVDNLKNINEKLWDIEDNIRIKESKKDFDSEFIELARAVYKTNDERNKVKNYISNLFNPDILDIKSYKSSSSSFS